MADDRDVLRAVWEGRVPAAFSLSPFEVETLTAPPPFYLMLPRQSYITVCTEKVRKHFAPSVSSNLQENPMWFEVGGAPLRWHLPVGVLFDLATAAQGNAKDAGGVCTTPWNVTVHFDKYPEKEILKCDSRDSVETFFMSSVKESDQLKHGGKVVSSMQKKDHSQLWQGLQNDKFDQFWAVNRRLMEPSQGTDGNGGFKHVPVRMYSAADGQMLPQRLFKTVDPETRAKTTLADLVKAALPDRSPEEVSVLTQGVRPSNDTPLQWMAEHLSYPDNFLYLIVEA